MSFKKLDTFRKLESFKKQDSDSVLVYSTDPKDLAKLNNQDEINRAQSEHKAAFDSRKFVAVFRLETNSRGGKTVTVIDQLPSYEPAIKDLTKELKSKCGSGGTYKIASDRSLIEIQGDKRDTIKRYFDTLKIKYKGM